MLDYKQLSVFFSFFGLETSWPPHRSTLDCEEQLNGHFFFFFFFFLGGLFICPIFFRVIIF
jgi:hypothetical protein